MISEAVRPWLFAVLLARLSGEGEVVEAGDTEHGVVDAIALELAVAQDLPALHAGEGVLNTGADLLVRPVVLLFPVREFFAFAALVWDDESGVLVTAVGDGHRRADGGLGTGLLPASGVVPVAGQGPADHDDQAGVGVDDDLMGRGIAVVLRLLGHRVVTGGDQGSVDDEDGVLTESLARLQREHRPEMVDDPVRRRLRYAEERCQLAHRQSSCASTPRPATRGPPAGGSMAVRGAPPPRAHAVPRSPTCRSSAGSAR